MYGVPGEGEEKEEEKGRDRILMRLTSGNSKPKFRKEVYFNLII